ncbi:MAG: flagellar basal body-associated FliL family protein [Actinobacteria bacterium]|nr:flagellar basal body-associated FliL family protein [Actinomycetota bacterium]
MEGKGFSAKMLVLILVVVIVLVAGAGGAAYFAVMKAIGQPPSATKNTKKESSKPFDAGEYITNLADPGGRKIIRIKIELEMAGAKDVEEMGKNGSAVRDQILRILRSKTVGDLAGEEGMEDLKREIINRLNVKVANGKVIDLHFPEFAVQ